MIQFLSLPHVLPPMKLVPKLAMHSTPLPYGVVVAVVVVAVVVVVGVDVSVVVVGVVLGVVVVVTVEVWVVVVVGVVVLVEVAVVVGVVTWQSRNDPPFQASYILLSVSAVASQLVPSYNTKSPR